MATGLGLRVTVRTSNALLLCPVIDQSASGGNPLASTLCFALPPRHASASVRARYSSRGDSLHSWCGKDCSLPISWDIDDSFSPGMCSDERLSDNVGQPEQELDSRGEVEEPYLPDDPSRVPSSSGDCDSPALNDNQRWAIVKKQLIGIMSNAQKQSQGVWHIRHSLGVDLGDSRTGVAISLKGHAPRPLSVLQLKGDKLIENLLQIASKERADEFIVGLPISLDGKETSQSTKTRTIAGRLATQAAQRGWRVYLLDEYGSSQGGLDYMLDIGIKKKSRKEKLDAYAALVLLHTYFSSKGGHLKLVLPKGLVLQERLCRGDDSIIDEFNMDNDF